MGSVKLRPGTQSAEGHRRRIYISGLDCIYDVGSGNFEFVFFINEPDGDGNTARRQMDESVVMHKNALPDAIGKALMALGRQVLVSDEGAITLMQ